MPVIPNLIWDPINREYFKGLVPSLRWDDGNLTNREISLTNNKRQA